MSIQNRMATEDYVVVQLTPLNDNALVKIEQSLTREELDPNSY